MTFALILSKLFLWGPNLHCQQWNEKVYVRTAVLSGYCQATATATAVIIWSPSDLRRVPPGQKNTLNYVCCVWFWFPLKKSLRVVEWLPAALSRRPASCCRMTAGCVATIAAENSVSIGKRTAFISELQEDVCVTLSDTTEPTAIAAELKCWIEGQLSVKFDFEFGHFGLYVQLAWLHIVLVHMLCKSSPGNCLQLFAIKFYLIKAFYSCNNSEKKKH